MSNRSVALVTGSSRGIGKAIALQLAKNGMDVAINYHSNDEKAQQVCSEIEQYGVNAIACKADVSSPEQVEAMLEKVEQELGSVSVLVNNAGLLKDNYLMMMSESQWDSVLDTNLKGAFLTSQLAIKNMIRARAGAILNIVSISGLVGTEGQANYAASKGGLIALTRSMSKELARYNIRVNAIAPGFISTEMIGQMKESIIEEQRKKVPLKRFGEAEEVGKLAGFMVSDDNSYMTGQTIVMDGGLSV